MDTIRWRRARLARWVFGLALAALCAERSDASVALSNPCDFNGDGKQDIVAQTGVIRVQLLDGVAVTQTGWMATFLPIRACGHLDLDGKSDLVLRAGVLAPYAYLRRMDGTAQLAQSFLTSEGWNFAVLADLVFNGPSGICIRMNEGPPPGAIQPVFAPSVCIPGSVSLLADLNGDGKADLVENAPDHTRVTLMDGTTPLDTAVLSNGGGAYPVRLAADLNGDGRDDLIGATDGGAYLLRQAGDTSGDGKADLLFDGPTAFRVTLMDGTTPTLTGWIPNAGGAYHLLDLRSP